MRAAITAYTLQLPAPTARARSDAGAPRPERVPRAQPRPPRDRVARGDVLVSDRSGAPSRAGRRTRRRGRPRHRAALSQRRRVGRDDAGRRSRRFGASTRPGSTPPAAPEPSGALAAAHYNGAYCYSMFGLHEEAFANIERALADRSRANTAATAKRARSRSRRSARIMSGDLSRARARAPRRTAHHRQSGDDRERGGMGNAGRNASRRPRADRDVVRRRGREPVRRARGLMRRRSRRGAGPARAAGGGGAMLHRAIPDCERPRGNVLTLLAAARYGAPEDVVRARAQLVAAADAPAELLERYAVPLFDAYVAHREGRHAAAVAPARAAADGFPPAALPASRSGGARTAGELGRRARDLPPVRRRLRRQAPTRRRAQPPRPMLQRAARTVRPRPALSQREREIAVLVARGKFERRDRARPLDQPQDRREAPRLGLSKARLLVAHATRGARRCRDRLRVVSPAARLRPSLRGRESPHPPITASRVRSSYDMDPTRRTPRWEIDVPNGSARPR